MFMEEQNTGLAKEMRQHIELWKASKMNPREYCVGKDFTVDKFNYWRYKIQKEQKGNHRPSTGFARVAPKANQAASPGLITSAIPSLEVNLSNGNRLVFYQDISKDLLKIFL